MTTMIKGIIQKVIMNTFGKFLKGIQKQKLSVDLFGGQFKLENISLNHQYFDQLNTPFMIQFSSIGKLCLQAPLSKLSSVPVECNLDNIFVVFKFKHENQQKSGIKQNKRQKIIAEIVQIFQSSLKKLRQQKKEDGMMARLGKKIVDNLQLKIKNIHIRFQQKDQYAWGLTLQEINLTTTDAEWKPCFVERKNEKSQKLYKMMDVVKLNLYWQSIVQKDKQKNEKLIIKSLEQKIKNTENTVLSLTSQFKLIINSVQNIQVPIYELEVDLKPIIFQIQRKQIIQMVNFARKNQQKNENIIKFAQKKNKIKLSNEDRQQYKQKYTQFINQILECYEAKNYNNLQKYQQFLTQIYSKINQQQLKVWSFDPIKSKIKVVRQTQLKKKKSGWFSRSQYQITLQQKNQLQNYINQVFQNDQFVRQPNLLLFKLKVKLQGGKATFIQHKGQDIQQNIQFNIQNILLTILKSQDQSYFQSHIQIKKMSLSLFLSIQKDNIFKKKKIQIFTTEKPKSYQIDSQQQESFDSFQSIDSQQPQQFLNLSYITQIQQKKLIKSSLKGKVEKITIFYKKMFMQKFKQFFNFKNSKFQIKKISPQLDHLQHITNEQQIQQLINEVKLQKIFDIDIKVNSPDFICPLNDRECWCLYLGSVIIKSNRDQQKQQYPILVQSAFLRYYPEIKQCFQLKNSLANKNIYSLINDMNFSIIYHKDKNKLEETFSLNLPQFYVNFTEKQYNNLLSLTKIFKTDQNQKRSVVQILKQQRKNIQQNKICQGFLFKKYQTLMSWQSYFGLLSGDYIYLYKDKKQLRQSQKFSLKNANIMIITNQEQQVKQLQLQIINQNQIWYLKCKTQDQFYQWHRQIQMKCRQFKTIHQLIKQHQQNQSKSNKKRSSSQNSINLLQNKKKTITINIEKISFKYDDQNFKSLLQFKIEQIFFSQQNVNSWSQKTLKLKKLIIIDQIYKYQNQAYQTLLQINSISYIQQIGRKKQKKQKKSSIKIEFGDFYINWKPDVLLILMKLASTHIVKRQNYRLDDDIQKSRDEHFKQVLKDPKVMNIKQNYQNKGKKIFVKQKRNELSLKSSFMKQNMTAEIEIKNIQINMVHRESHLVILKIISNNIFCRFSNCDSAKFLKGTVHDMQLYDMTGYPQKQYKQSFAPFKLLQKIKSQKPFIQFRWSSYDPINFPNQQRIDSFIWMSIQPFYYQYYQQIAFRTIDYILIQVILLITQPQMITVNENLMQQLKRKEQIKGQKPIKVLYSRYQEIIKKLINPYFMDIYVILKNPILKFKAQKISHIYYKLVISQLIFYNKTSKNNKRFFNQKCKQVKQLIYEDQFIIHGKDCHFIQISQKLGQQKQLFQPFKMQAIVNKLIFEDEINILFPQVSKYDRSFITINKISNIIISHYSRLQYLNINKLVNFNFTYDDQWDELFIHNFKITKLLIPKPIIYDVFVPEIHMTADYNARQDSEQVWKLFKAVINKFNLQYKRNKDLQSSITINIGITQILGYQYIQTQLQPISHQLMTLGSKQLQKNNTQIFIQNKSSGKKFINMTIDDLKVNVRTGLLQLILQYTLIQDWVFPQVNKFVPQLIFNANVSRLNALLLQDINTIINDLKNKNVNPQLIKNALKNQQVLALFKLQGVLCYKFCRIKNQTNEQWSRKLSNKQILFKDIQKLPPVATMTAILSTQIYRTTKKQNEKRKIMDQFTLIYDQKKQLRVADDTKCILKTISSRNINMDKCLIRISFKDLIVFQSILKQINQQRKYIVYLNQATGKNTIVQQGIKNFQHSSLQKMDLRIESANLYLIYSSYGIFIPIIKVSLSNSSILYMNTIKKNILQMPFQVTISYFNKSIFRWQPMIEKTALNYNKITFFNQQNNNTVQSSLQSSGPIMINISKQIITTLKQTQQVWNMQQQQQKQKYKKQKIQIKQPQQFVSYFVIRNQIGYDIQIFNIKGQFISMIPHLSQIDFKQQTVQYDNDQNQIFIGFKINHPKIKLLPVSNISLNIIKDFHFVPRSFKNQPLKQDCKIFFKTQIKNCKKIIKIQTSKIIYDYTSKKCQILYLPFDHQAFFQLPKGRFDISKISLYEDTTTKNFRFIGRMGTLKIMKLYLIYNYSPIPLNINGIIVASSSYVGISQKLTIQNAEYKKSILKVTKNKDKTQYYIHAQCFIVDYYGLYFDFGSDSPSIFNYSYTNKQSQTPSTIYVLPKSKQYKFKVKFNGIQSQKVTLRTNIGKSSFKIFTKQAECPFVIYTYISAVSPLEKDHPTQFRTIVEITPEYVLSNSTKYAIKICQVNCVSSMTLNSGQRIPFFWQNKQKPKLIKLAFYHNNTQYGYSGSISLLKNTQTVVLRNSLNLSDYKILNIKLQVTNTVTFIHLIQSSNLYTIKNNVAYSTLRVYQMVVKNQDLDLQCPQPQKLIFTCGYKQQKAFGYDLPLQSHKLMIQVQMNKQRQQYKQTQINYQLFDDIQTSIDLREIKIINKHNKYIKKLFLNLNFENNIKKIKLQEQMYEEQTQNSYQYSIKVPQIGVSFIGYHNEIRKQIFHIIFQDLRLSIIGNLDYIDYDLLIHKCRIENQISNNSFFPILFQNYITKKAPYFLNFLLSKSTKNSRLIHYIGVSINKSNLSITSVELQTIQQNINQINKQQLKITNKLRKNQLFNQNVPHPQESIFFQQCVIHPLNLIISFRPTNQWGGSLFKTFSGINQSLISAQGLTFTSVSCNNMSDFLKILIKHYQDRLTRMLLPMIGNLTILGSPVTLFSKMGSGLKDLVQLPAQGFQISPLHAGKGVFLGVKSLLGNTIYGAFNTVEGLTGSVSNGISSLVDDDTSYARDRRNIKNDKSQHFFDGLGNGAKSIGYGLFHGVAGVFRQPVRGAQKDGLKGLLFGTLKGFGGLIIKPVSGVIDAASKTAQGIKNTTQFFDDQMKDKLIRRHKPRPFYNYYKQFRNYDTQLAQLIQLIEQHDDKLVNLSWCGHYEIQSKQKRLDLLVLSYEYLFIYNFYKKQLIYKIKCSDLISVQLFGTQIKIQMKKSDRKQKKASLGIQVISGCYKLMKQLQMIIRHQNPNILFG